MEKSKLNPQAQRILKKLQEYEGRWVPLPEILAMFIGSYTRRLTEIRRAGYNVELKDERVDGQRHTSYRLVKPTAYRETIPFDMSVAPEGKERSI